MGEFELAWTMPRRSIIDRKGRAKRANLIFGFQIFVLRKRFLFRVCYLPFLRTCSVFLGLHSFWLLFCCGILLQFHRSAIDAAPTDLRDRANVWILRVLQSFRSEIMCKCGVGDLQIFNKNSDNGKSGSLV